MSTDNTWEAFFNAHAPQYDENIFTKNTAAEIDFLVAELRLPAGARILDIGCGTGRHTVALAQRGYRMTGVDLSAAMLAQAQARAAQAGVDIAWVHGDATRVDFPAQFDAVLCLCEGAFGLLGAGDDALGHPLAVLRMASRALCPGGKTLFTVLSATRLIRAWNPGDTAQRFDPLTLSVTSEVAPTEGATPLTVRERGFVPTELRLLFALAGLTVRVMWGGTAGHWAHRPLEPDEYEIMIMAEKTGEPIEFALG
jgi:ubiquinone/menaquinone biosynthesis C-methylase UbiE